MTDQITDLTIESLAYGGDGVAHLEGRVLFVPGAFPADTARIRVVQDKGSYLRGELLEIVSPSPDRAHPLCPYSAQCGGCQWQELSYPAQLAWKRTIVEESLHRLGGIDRIEVEPCVPSPVTCGYRTVARYPSRCSADGLVMGYHERRTHRIVDIETCPMASAQVNRIAGSIRGFFRNNALHLPKPFDLQEITIQASYNLPSAIVRFTLRSAPHRDSGNHPACASYKRGPRKNTAEISGFGEKLLAEIEELSGVSFVAETSPGNYRQLLTLGTPYRYEQVNEKIFRIEERSFFQINIPQTENLVRLAGEMLQYDTGDRLADCYGGVGLFSLSLAVYESPVFLFDVSPWAVEDSRFNAAAMGYTRFTGMVGDAGSILGKDASGLPGIGPADLLILDPPRTGLGLMAVEEMCRFEAKRMVYVSCNPTTLARDLRYFSQKGYTVKRIVPVDMFPQTYHIETAALLEKS